MIPAVRMLQHILPIVLAETSERFLLVESMQLGKGKYFTGDFICTGLVTEQIILNAVSEWRGGVVVIFGNDRHDLVKFDTFRVDSYASQYSVQSGCHSCSSVHSHRDATTTGVAAGGTGIVFAHNRVGATKEQIKIRPDSVLGVGGGDGHELLRIETTFDAE